MKTIHLILAALLNVLRAISPAGLPQPQKYRVYKVKPQPGTGRVKLYPTKEVVLANERAGADEAAEIFSFANQLQPDEKGWVQLAPYGDFPNVDAKGREVIQRFAKGDAEVIVNEFKSLANLPQRLLGLPWYVGHPDHPRFKGQPGHTDSAAKGRIKSLEAREDGLYANVKFNDAGRQLVEGEAFHGHSVNWTAVPVGMENGKAIFAPRGLKSVGFTNNPQIPVVPASLANENGSAVPPKLKVLAGFKEDADVSMDEVIAALEKAVPVANERPEPVEIAIGDEKFSVVLVNEESAAFPQKVADLRQQQVDAHNLSVRYEQQLANERKARATDFVDGLIKAGQILIADKEARITELANSGEKYGEIAQRLANAKPVVKTTPKTAGLGGKNHELQTDVRSRQAKFDEMLAQRIQQFPNESYDERFAAVAKSEAGQQLFAQMKRAGAEE